MKIKGRIKMFTTMFIIVARVNCDFLLDSLSEMKLSLQLLQDSVEKISLEQLKTNEKVDQLQRDMSKVDNGVKSLSLEQIKTNEKIDLLHKDISKVNNKVESLSMDINSMHGTNIDTLEDIYEANNRTFEAIDQLQNEMITTKMDSNFKNDCNDFVNVTLDVASNDAENQDSTGNLDNEEEEEKGK